MKITFIAWVRFDRRPDLLAHHLGATMHFVTFGRRGNTFQTPLRYVVQAFKSWQILHQERPDLVVVQNPPIFCVIVALLYSRVYGARYAIDSHSGAFLSPKWGWSVWLHRLLSRRAVTTIVQNKYLENAVRGWGCHVSLLGYTPGAYPAGESLPVTGQFNIAVVSTYTEDEPLDMVFEAAARLPEIQFYVTGDSNRISPGLLALKPENCHLTGYLSYERYIGLLREVDALIDLTTQDHTLLMGGYEAVSLGTPLITSDWPVLRDYFSQGTVHVPNTVEGIYAGVRRAQYEQATLRRDILRLREQLSSEWTHKLTELQEVLAGF